MDKCKLTMDERILMFMERMSPYVNREMTSWLESHGFFTAPASTKYHGAYEGGLFDHSFEVAQTLWKLTKDNNLKWERPESPLIVGMFHDLCKIDQYIPRYGVEEELELTSLDKPGSMHLTNTIVGYDYNPDTLLKGHGDKSVMLLSQFYRLTEEEICCIRYHMGAFTSKEEWNDYTRAVRRYPNVLWTHHADMIASHVKGV